MARTDKPVKVNHGAAAEAEAKPSSRGGILGWVLVPALLLGALFLGGVYVGANMPASWITEAVVWIGG